jgi:acetoin utilization deacetylase AcuC-like enzyme
MRESVTIHYTEKQVCTEQIKEESYSMSPLKPALYIEAIKTHLTKYPNLVRWNTQIKPFRRRDFFNAHTPKYVENFFDGVNNCTSNGIPWSKELARSVRYTNSSLYTAINASVHQPNDIHVSPTSGFHHARPEGGSGFCTFSGQVIASLKLYRKHKLKGAYLDLDGHHGNSIEDSRWYVEDRYGIDLDEVIPMNINPKGCGETYLCDLQRNLFWLEDKIIKGEVDYVVWCHGADSHQDDDLGHQLSTKQWIEASTRFYQWLNDLEKRLGRKIPLTLSLFGGYRKDDYDSVINLHLTDLIVGINHLTNKTISTKRFKVNAKVATYV